MSNTLTILACFGLLLVIILLLVLIFQVSGQRRANRTIVKDSVRDISGAVSDTQKDLAVLQEKVGVMTDAWDGRLSDMSVNQDQRMKALSESVFRMQQSNDERMEAIRKTVEDRLTALQQDNNRQLEEMRNTVDEKLQETLESRITKSFELVNQRLTEVYSGLGEMRELASGVGDLKKVLSNVKTRGILGEVQLGAILDQILSPEQYAENVETIPGSNKRVEFAVRLPGDEDRVVWLPIDSKFPLDQYQHLLDAQDSADRQAVSEAKKALSQAILSFAKDIRTKYVQPPYTTDFGIMFLPTEGLYAEVVSMGMVEELQTKYKVNIAGPTTMAALLNSLQMGFRTLAIQKHSGEVWETLGAVRTEFDNFQKVLESTQNRLRQANEDLDKLIGTRSRQIRRKLKEVESLDELEARQILGLEGYDDYDGTQGVFFDEE